ncbi:kinesin-like protein [Hibiscus syriacus]|uniref:Kinesin-like protein n=1 Tax=Hibiscus syriacus TaxID=106335 RepID=A0A6A3B680_HIBSY|nr:kinesin-like protein [Hibiscus syriacus]
MMAIEKNNLKVSRFDSEFSPCFMETTVSSDEDEIQRQSSVVVSDGSDDDDEFDDADSGAGSDDYDLLELGETEAEFCQVGNSTCSVPFELYDLLGLEDILSLDVWNECLSDEDRFSLAKFLPDMDQGTFMRTLNDLLKGDNFHFGSPMKKLFDMLKGGLCEPRVTLYQEGLNFFQKRRHYHHLRKHQNNMVVNLCQIRDIWAKCRGYSIEEQLRVLSIMRSQKSLMQEKLEDEILNHPEERIWVKDFGAKGLRTGRGQLMALEPEKYGKLNPKGKLKTGGSKFPSAKEYGNCVYPDLDMNSEPYGFPGTLPRQTYKSGAVHGPRDWMRLDDEAEDPMFGTGSQRHRNVVRDSTMGNSGSLRAGKKYGRLRAEELAGDSYLDLPFSSKQELQAHGRNRNMNQLSEAKVYTSKPPNMRTFNDFAKKAKYSENQLQSAVAKQKKSLKGRNPPLPLKGSQVDLSEGAEMFSQNKNRGEDFSLDSSLRSDDWNIRGKKWKTGQESPDFGFISHTVSSSLMNDQYLQSDSRMKPSQKKIRGNYVQNGGPVMNVPKGSRAFIRNEETESDSSEHFDDDDDGNPLIRSKLAYPSGVIKDSRLSSLKSGLDSKMTKSLMKNSVKDGWTVDGIIRYSKKSSRENMHVPEIDGFYLKGKQKGKMHESNPLHYSAYNTLDEVDRKQVYKLGKNDRLRMSSSRVYLTQKRQKGELVYDQSLSQSNYLHNYLVDEEDASPVTEPLTNEYNLGCNKVTKKRKGKEYVAHTNGRGEGGNLQSNLQQQTNDSLFLKKKGKRKLKVDTGALDNKASEAHLAEVGALDVKIEAKPQKKPFTLITPTVHTSFSFSIIHLLSSVRLAMISPLPEDSVEVSKPREEQNGKQEGGMNGVLYSESAVSNNLEHQVQASVPSLTVQEIVSRVTVNPGDPCILETQEPLQDLVWGVLKIFSSKTAPLGAKGWKALEVTSPEAWGLPHKVLVKLVDSFANWLTNGQETLQQIGSLPTPPLELMQFNLDEKERFRDLKAQKSLNTISPSSEEVRAYFRREELLRYSIPDRAFSYTAADGKKSVVAPLRRCGGKPTSKARDHFMLKRYRPPHVTILCIVRDAAARLPGSIGTRADVCTLIRDSQYIVEDVSDAQVNQVVSGALDRLHYERDPCVQFDGERKLWVYLHREREEEDFEDDGTSSTKKWKRQKKDFVEQPDQGVVTVAFHATGDQPGLDLGSDLNVDPPCTDGDKKMETDFHDRQNVEDNADTDLGSEQGNSTWSSCAKKANCYVKKIPIMKNLMTRLLGERSVGLLGQAYRDQHTFKVVFESSMKYLWRL